MHREYHKWYSPHLNKDMELLLFGTAGRPVIAFPTSMGRFYQNEDFSLITTLTDRLTPGIFKWSVSTPSTRSRGTTAAPPRKTGRAVTTSTNNTLFRK